MSWANPFPYSGNCWNHVNQPSRLYEQNFGLGLFDDDLLMSVPRFHNWAPRFRATEKDQIKSGLSELHLDKDKYQVMLDVQHFKPEEITVKSVDNALIIEGRHEEKADEHGYISRSFVRRYILPDDVRVDHVECNLSSDGVLTLKASRLAALKQPEHRAIPVIFTGKPVLKERPAADEPAAMENGKEMQNGS